MHPGYADVQGDLLNDIALLLLDAPVTTITPISYARSPSTAIPGMSVRAIGWGDTLATPRYPPNFAWSISISYRSISRTGPTESAAMTAVTSPPWPPEKTPARGTAAVRSLTPTAARRSPLLLGITSFGLDCAQRGIPGHLRQCRKLRDLDRRLPGIRQQRFRPVDGIAGKRRADSERIPLPQGGESH